MERPKSDKFNNELVNERVRFPQVRLIGPEGEQLGTMSSREAMAKADEYGLDLLCVAPNGQPPVCKLINYGKYKFEQQKQQRANKKKTREMIIETKEIQLTPQIGEHDLLTKVKASIKFLQDGDKLKVGVRFRGRQMAHIEVGQVVMDKFLEYVKEYGTFDTPVMDNRTLTCIVTSKTKK